MTRKNGFLIRYSENADLNQYWYSAHTIEVLVKELEAVAEKVAFLSTPSIFFSLPKGGALRANSWVFDLDHAQFGREKNFHCYDFNQPLAVPKALQHAFDCVVVDPPFITEEVWAKYAATIQLLLQDSGKVIASTIPENAGIMQRLLSASTCQFRPSIPHLVYQYCFYANYDTSFLCEMNAEIPED